METRIWTRDTLGCLFQSVVRRFDPYSTWEFYNMPGHGRDWEYAHWCRQFAECIGAESQDAIAFRIARQSIRPNLKGHQRTAAAALDAGFIRPEHIGLARDPRPGNAWTTGMSPLLEMTERQYRDSLAVVPNSRWLVRRRALASIM